MRREGTNSSVLMERGIELHGLALSFDISGDKPRSIEAFRQAKALFDALSNGDPDDRNLVARKAKLSIQLGAELTSMGALDRARDETSAGAAALQRLIDQGAPPDTGPGDGAL